MQKYLQSYWFLATVFLDAGLENDWQWKYVKDDREGVNMLNPITGTLTKLRF